MNNAKENLPPVVRLTEMLNVTLNGLSRTTLSCYSHRLFNCKAACCCFTAVGEAQWAVRAGAASCVPQLAVINGCGYK